MKSFGIMYRRFDKKLYHLYTGFKNTKTYRKELEATFFGDGDKK